MKAYNTPKDELHIESDTGETLVSITPEKTTIANLEGGGAGGGEVGPGIGTTHIVISALEAYQMLSGEEITTTITGIKGHGEPQPAMLKCALRMSDVDAPFFLYPMSMGHYGGGFYTNSKLYYIVCEFDNVPYNPTTAYLWAYEIG